MICSTGTGQLRLLQGIKFYEPEVVGATPEAVEYQGLQNLLAAVQEHVGYRHGKLIFSADGQVGDIRCRVPGLCTLSCNLADRQPTLKSTSNKPCLGLQGPLYPSCRMSALRPIPVFHIYITVARWAGRGEGKKGGGGGLEGTEGLRCGVGLGISGSNFRQQGKVVTPERPVCSLWLFNLTIYVSIDRLLHASKVSQLLSPLL